MRSSSLHVYRATEEASHVTGPTQRVYLSTNASADVKSIRQEEFRGRTYTVIPVVAIVETVLQGANSPAPELALASEFGKFPQSWNGRPVVLNHPSINGVFVSASIPSVLEDYAFGTMFNAYVDQKKLLVEAWIDDERVAELGGEFAEVLTRANAGEEIEVSVGAYLDVIKHRGELNGRTYEGVWQNVVPDHLAILSKGSKGACTNADGCGMPRVHEGETSPTSFRVNCNSDGSPCCDGCKNGTGCTQEAPVNLSNNAENTGNTENGGGQSATNEANGTDAAAPSTGNTTPPNDVSVLVEGALRAEKRAELFDNFTSIFGINSVPGNVVLDDVRCLVRQGLQELLDVSNYDFELLALTTEVAVFYVWGSQGIFNQIKYNLGSDGAVNFIGDPEPVNLLTTIQPRQTSTHTGGSNASGIGTTTGPNINGEGDDDMAGNGQGNNAGAGTGNGQGGNSNEGGLAPPNHTTDNPAENQQGGGDGDGNGSGDAPPNNNAAAATPQTVADWLKSAPAEISAVLSGALATQESRRESLVKVLLAAKGNRLDEATLKAMPIATLEGMHALVAAATPQVATDFSGRAGGFDGDLSVHSNRPKAPAVAAAPASYLGRPKADANANANAS
jgi:hypothetical protein